MFCFLKESNIIHRLDGSFSDEFTQTEETLKIREY